MLQIEAAGLISDVVGLTSDTTYVEGEKGYFLNDYLDAKDTAKEIQDRFGQFGNGTIKFHITADGLTYAEAQAAYKDELDFTWSYTSKAVSEAADADFTALTSYADVSKVGTYKLQVGLNQHADATKANYCEPLVCYLVIEPTELTLKAAAGGDLYGTATGGSAIRRGTTVADVKAKSASFALYNGTDPVDKNAYLSDATVSVRLTGTDTDLADTVVLEGNGDYTIVYTLTWTDVANGNFTVEKTTFLAVLSDLVKTQFDFTQATLGGYAKVYDGTALDKAAVLADITEIKILYDKDGDNNIDTDDEKAALSVDVKAMEALEDTNDTKSVWGYWAVKDARLTAKAGTDDVYQRWVGKSAEETAPVDAGTYYYVFEYVDPNGTYASASVAVPVNISQAQVSVIPTGLKADSGLNAAEIYDGTPMSEILKAVEYKVVDATGAELAIDKDHFWGSLYQEATGWVNNNDNIDPGVATTNSYQPLFAIKRTATVTDPKTDDEKKPVVEYFDLEAWDVAYGTELIESEGTVVVGGVTRKCTYSYALVFIGKKAVFEADGQARQVCGINDAEENYRANTDKTTTEETAGNFLTIAIKAAVATTIDVSAIDAGLGLTFAAPDVRQYKTGEDGTAEGLYTSKADYKKAKVTAGGTAVASDTDASLTYTWERFDDYFYYNYDVYEYVQGILLDGSNASKDNMLAKLYQSEDDQDPADPTVVYGAEEYITPDTDTYNAMTDEQKQEEAKKAGAYDAWEKAWTTNTYYNFGTVEGAGFTYSIANDVNSNGEYDINGKWRSFANSATPAPSSPGVYRLHVNYTDDTHANKSSDAYVYFTIQPATAYVEWTGSPKAFADGEETAATWLDRVDPNSADANTKVGFTLYPGTLSGDTVTKSGETPIALPEKLLNKIASTPKDFLLVQKLVDDGKGGTTWKTQNNNDKIRFIDPGTGNYRLILNETALKAIGIEYDDNGNATKTAERAMSFYNLFGSGLGSHNQVLDAKDLTSGVLAMTIVQSLGVPVVITIDENAITDVVKTYDGKAFDMTQVAAAISVTDGDTGADIKATVAPNYRFYTDVSVADDGTWQINDTAATTPADQVIHAGSYLLEVYTNANETYKSADSTMTSKAFKIEQRELIVEPTLKTDIKAGSLVTSYLLFDGSSNPRRRHFNYVWVEDTNKNGLIDPTETEYDEFATSNLINDVVVDTWCEVTVDGGEVSYTDADGNTVTENAAAIISLADIEKEVLVFDSSINTAKALTPDNIVALHPNQRASMGSYDDPTNLNLPYTGYLKTGDSYYLYVNGEAVSDYNSRDDIFGNTVSYGVDYTVKDVVKDFTAVRGSGSVGEIEVTLADAITGDAAPYSHTVTTLSGIPVDPQTNNNHKQTHKNYLEFYIDMPKEYIDNADYANAFGTVANAVDKEGKEGSLFAWKTSIENAIKTAGIDIDENYPAFVRTSNDRDHVTGATYQRLELYIDATTIKAMEGDAKAITFDIAWTADYTETFTIDLTKSDLIVDLSQAVAPKSIKFNGVSKKMAVGESQQLDVKVVKKEPADIIWLGYESSDPEVLQVTDSTDAYGNYGGAGYVTALKKGSATITVYPCVEVYDSQAINSATGAKGAMVKTPIDGVKPVKIKITVTDVAKVKIANFKAYDSYVSFNYKRPANGYRREYYILEGKVNAKNAEAAVAAVTNGDFSAFAAAQIASDELTIDYKAAKIGETVVYDGKWWQSLNPQTQYTLYVRNVSGIRELDNGAEVALSAAGVVKTFKTTKAQVWGLQAAVKDEQYLNYSESMYDFNTGTEGWRVDFAEKKAQIVVKGSFTDKYSKTDEKAADIAADINGYTEVELPLSGANKKLYQAPKLKYVVYTGTSSSSKPSAAELKEYSKITVNGVTTYFQKTNIAKINGKGVLTFKGEGIVYVRVIDTVTGRNDDIPVFIDAAPTAMTKKNIKVEPGETVFLSDALGYKQGSAKVVDYQSSYINNDRVDAMFSDLTADGSADGYKVERVKKDSSLLVYNEDKNRLEEQTIYDYEITALKAGSGKLTLTVTDSEVAKNGGQAITVDVTTGNMEPVKALATKYIDKSGIQAGFVYDNSVKGSFTHSKDNLTYKVELFNKKGELLDSRVYKDQEADYFNKKTKKYVYSWGYAPNDNAHGISTAFDGDRMSDYSLTRMSNYTVAVTVLNTTTADADASKTVKKKFKTTNIPASRFYSNTDWNAAAVKGLTGINVRANTRIAPNGNITNNRVATLSNYPILTSGNTYTLEAMDTAAGLSTPVLVDAKAGETDKLTWKSTNTKVATVKALKGTFSATLTAKKAGFTEIQVKSKITKKLVASWFVYVSAVGDAEGYYGTNEPYAASVVWEYDYKEIKRKDLSAQDIIEVTLGAPVSTILDRQQEQWFVFEAPEHGVYTFNTNDESIDNKELQKGEKYYFSVTNGNTENYVAWIQVTGYMFNTITLGGTNKVLANDYFTFTAPEDNVYYFSFTGDDGETYYIIGDGNYNVLKSAGGVAHGMKKGETFSAELGKYAITAGDVVTIGKEYAITIDRRVIKAAVTEAGVEYSLDSEDAENWFSYTATADGYYRFVVTPKSGTLSSTKYIIENIENKSTDTGLFTKDGNDLTDAQILLEAGQTIYFGLNSSLASEKEKVEGTIAVEASAATALTAGAAETTTSVKAGSKALYTFTPAEAGYYTITATAKTNTTIKICKGSANSTPIKTINGNTDSYILAATDASDFETYYVVVENNSSETADTESTLAIVKRSFVNLTSEATKTAITKNGELYYAFAAPEKKYTGNYTVTFTMPTGSNYGIYEVNYDGTIKDTWATAVTSRVYTNFNAPDIMYFKVTSNIAGDVEALYAEVVSTEIPVGSASSAVAWSEDADETAKIFTFTPAENGLYTFTFVSTVEATASEFTTVTAKKADGTGLTTSLVTNNEEDATSHATTYAVQAYLKKADGPVTFTVAATTGNKASITATATKRTTEALASGDTGNSKTVSKNSEAWYTFKADEKAFYEFSYTVTSDNGNATITVYDGENGSHLNSWGAYTKASEEQKATEAENSALSVNLNKLRTLYFKVENSADADVTVNIKITKKAITEIKSTATVELTKTAKEKWYVFNTPDDGYYTIVFKATAKASPYTISRSDTMFDSAVNWTNVGSTDISDAASAYAIRRATVTNNGKPVWFKAYTTTDLGDSDKIEGTITVIRSSVTDIKDNEASWSISYDGAVSQQFRYTASATGYYTFDFAAGDSANNLNIVSTGTDVTYKTNTDGNNDTASVTEYLVMGNTVTFTINDNNNSTSEKAFAGTIKVTKAATTPLSLGTAATYSVAENEKALYTYTVKSTGLYVVTMDPTAESASLVVKRAASSTATPATINVAKYSGSGSFGTLDKDSTTMAKTEYFLLEKGDMLTFEVTGMTADKTATGSVKIAAGTTDNISTGTAKAVSVDGTGETWYRYVAADDDTYTLNGYDFTDVVSYTFYKLSDGSFTVYPGWSGSGTKDGDVYGFTKSDEITAGMNFFIKVKSTAATDEKAVTGNVRITVPTEVEVGTQASYSVTKKLSETMKFTAEADDFYTFTFKRSGTGNVTVTLDGETQSTTADSDTVKFVRYMESDYSIAITVEGASSLGDTDTAAGTLDVTKGTSSFTKITANTGAVDLKLAEDGYQYYIFNVEDEGEFNLKASSNTANVITPYKWNASTKKWVQATVASTGYEVGSRYVIGFNARADIDAKAWLENKQLTLGKTATFVAVPGESATNFGFTTLNTGIYRVTYQAIKDKGTFKVNGNAVTTDTSYSDSSVKRGNMNCSTSAISTDYDADLDVVEGQITVTDITDKATAITNGENTGLKISVSEGEAWFVFTTDDEGSLTEETTTTFTGVDYSFVCWMTDYGWESASSIASLPSSGTYMRANDKLFIRLKNNDSATTDKTGSITLKFGGVVEIQLNELKEYTSDIQSAYTYKLKVPTVTEETRYKLVVSTNDDTNAPYARERNYEVQVYGVASGTNESSRFEMDSSRGYYYFIFEPRTTTAKVSFKVIEAEEATVITTTENGTVNLAADASADYAFTATENGIYSFSLTGSGLEGKYQLEGGWNEETFNPTVSGSAIMRSGQTMNITVTASSAISDGTVSVSKISATSLTKGTASDSVTLANQYSDAWFSYTSIADGLYSFTTTDTSNNSGLYIYTGDSDTFGNQLDNVYYGNSISGFVDDGATVYIRVINRSGSSVSLTGTVTDDTTVKSLNLDEEYTLSSGGANKQYFKFTATAEGYYTVALTQNTDGYYYVYTDYGQGNSFSRLFGIDYDKSGTDTLYVSNTGTVYLKLENCTQAGALKVSSPS